MTIPVFPALSKVPSRPLDPDGNIEDGVIRSPQTAGYEQTRPRFTRTRRGYGVNYRHLPDTDVATLRAFEITTLRNGADAFTWTHPVDGTAHTVQIVGGIKFAKTEKPTARDVSFMLREV